MAFPADPLDVTVELFYDSAWNDHTAATLDRDGNSSIVITRGRGNDSGRADPSHVSLKFNNTDGTYSPLLPTSSLYGKIGYSTPIRISYTYNAVDYVRFVGEIEDWPSRWDPSGSDVWVQIEAWSILNSLGQGGQVRSALHRTILGDNAIAPHAYWSMEDGSGATRFASALPGGRPMLNGALNVFGGAPAGSTNAIRFADISTLAGSKSLPAFGETSYIGAQIPTYTDTGRWASQMMVYIPAEFDTLTGLAVSEYWTNNPSLPVVVVGLNLSAYQLTVRVYQSDLTTVAAEFFPSLTGRNDLIDRWVSLAAVSIQDGSGANDTLTVQLLDIDGNSLGGDIQNISTTFHSTLSRVFHRNLGASASGTGFGHSTVWTDPSWTVATDGVRYARAAGGHRGEQAHERVQRLCDEEGVAVAIVGDVSALMGPQRDAAFLDVLDDCATTGRGLVFEQRDDVGLAFRTNLSRYGQAGLTLDYSAGQIHPPLEPTPNPFVNDVTVSQRGGSFARAVEETGPLSVNVRRRESPPITVDAYDEDQLDQIANWVKTLGTQNVQRYRTVHVNLAANPGLIAGAATSDTQDRLVLTTLPAWMPPDDPDLVIEGYTETISQFSLDITFNCSPGNLYQQVGRWALLSHELHANINSSVTSIDIANTDTSQPMLATSGLGSGYGVTVGGEEMQVTAVADSLVTFGATGTVTHANNANVTPGIPASVATGNLLLCLAAIRNSGTGVPNTPSGYTRLAVFPATANVQVFAKIATSGAEAAPTISFTGGVANADTSAQMIRLAGKWHSVNNILLGAAWRLNPSAQDIIVPGLPKPICDNCFVIGAAWKQDDWTSVATRAGFTEIGEPDTTTGDDQGIVWDYAIQTTATAVAATPFVVTGGAGAISRSTTFALRCDYQTATVERGTNGFTASHSAGDDVTETRPMRWGLL